VEERVKIARPENLEIADVITSAGYATSVCLLEEKNCFNGRPVPVVAAVFIGTGDAHNFLQPEKTYSNWDLLVIFRNYKYEYFRMF